MTYLAKRAEKIVGHAGKGLETRALPAPEATQKITNHAHSTPLHRLQDDQLLPTRLLTPFQVPFYLLHAPLEVE